MNELIDFVGKAGYPVSISGILAAIFFYLRKHESMLRTETMTSLTRLQREKESLEGIIAKMAVEEHAREAYIDDLREKLRESQDELHRQKRRAESAEARLKSLGFSDM